MLIYARHARTRAINRTMINPLAAGATTCRSWRQPAGWQKYQHPLIYINYIYCSASHLARLGPQVPVFPCMHMGQCYQGPQGTWSPFYQTFYHVYVTTFRILEHSSMEYLARYQLAQKMEIGMPNAMSTQVRGPGNVADVVDHTCSIAIAAHVTWRQGMRLS